MVGAHQRKYTGSDELLHTIVPVPRVEFLWSLCTKTRMCCFHLSQRFMCTCVMESVTGHNRQGLESQGHVCPRALPTAHFAPSLRLAIIACGVGHSTWLSQAALSVSQVCRRHSESRLTVWWIQRVFIELPNTDWTSAPTREKCSLICAALHWWVRVSAGLRQQDFQETKPIFSRTQGDSLLQAARGQEEMSTAEDHIPQVLRRLA